MSLKARKTVTVLFVDVVDSTPLGEQLDAESLRQLMASWFDEAEDVIARYGGTVEKFIGDAVMAVFGVPTSHEDDALRAVRAAVELRGRVATLNADLERRFGASLQIRTGINTGEAVAGESTIRQSLVTGDVVNTGKRLEQLAGAGEILVGASTRALVAGAASVEPVGPLAAKGKSEPVEAWRVLEVDATSLGVPRRLEAPLVGRRNELATLHEALERATAARRCEVATLLGAAGIGKSRLARELTEEVEGWATVLTGRCLSYGSGITFWPVLELLEHLGGDERVAAIMDGHDDAALVRERLQALAGQGSAGTDEIFWALRRLFEALAAAKPLVICLEDVHWAEPTLHDLVEYLAGWISEAPVLLLRLARPEVLESGQIGGARAGTLIELDPLSPEESGELLDGLGVDPELHPRIAEAAEGNPLFVEQLAAVLSSGEFVEGEIPPSIGALLEARLDRLDPGERRVLERAAVVGKEFTRTEVAGLLADDERAAAGRQLLSLLRKGLVRPSHRVVPGDDVLRFRHALIRDAAYRGLPKLDRAILHESFANQLGATPELDEILAFHLEQAYRYRTELRVEGPDERALARRAAEHYAAAGRRAQRARGDARTAKTLLGRAADLLSSDDAERPGILLDLGSSLIRTGALADAESSFSEAEETGDDRVRLRAQVERGFVRSFVQPEGSSEEIVRIIDAAIPGLEALGDDAGLAKAWWLASEVHVIGCRWRRRADALELALRHARAAGEPRLEGTIIALLAQALHYGPTPAEDAIARCEEFLGTARGPLEADIASTLAGLRAMRDEIDAARALYAHGCEIYDELGLTFTRAARSIVGAEIELAAGDPCAAAAELRTGHDTLLAIGEQGVRSTVAAFLSRALLEAGDQDGAARFTEISEAAAAHDDLVTQVVWRATRARVTATEGDTARALELADTAVSLAAPTDFPFLKATALLARAGVTRDVADAERGRDLMDAKGDLASVRAIETAWGLASPARAE